MAIHRKTIIVVAVIVAAAIILVALLLSVIANPDRYRPEVISYLEGKTGKQIEVGHLGVNWIPPSIRLDNFGCRNPKPFPPGYFLKAARVDASIDATALLHGQIVIKSVVLHDPIINVISDPDGLWNFENPPSKTSQKQPPIAALGVISRVEITGGQLFASSLIDPSDRPGPVVLEAHNVAATLEHVDLDGFMSAASTVVAQGSLKATLLRFGSVEAQDMDSKLRLQARHVVFADIKAEAYDGSAVGDLSFDLSGKNTTFNANTKLSGMSVARLLLTAFPNAGGKMTGTMEGELKLAGEIEHTLRPLAGIHGTGRVTVRNGEVPGLELNANLMKLAHFNDLGPAQNDPSSFSLISTDLELDNQRISSRVIDIDGYGVDVDGSGNVSLSGSDEVHYQGLAEITTKESFFTNTAARLFGGATLKDGKLEFPFRISGTIENPVFSKGKGDKDVDDPRNHRVREKDYVH
jgi:uncharacterized protein involved in outer membrane biogenesis